MGAGAGKTVNRSETAELFGVSLTTVDNWRRSGCPTIKDGKSVLFNSADVSTWLRERDVRQALGGADNVTVDEARRRREAAEAGLAELRLAKERRLVVAVEDVQAIVADEYAATRSRLLAIHGNVEMSIAHLVTPAVLAQVAGAVKAEVAEALEGLVGDVAGQ